jgi:hypothetical protein
VITSVWQFPTRSFTLAPRRVSARGHEVVQDAERKGNLIGIRLSWCDSESEETDPWLMPPSRNKRQEQIEGPLPELVRVTLSNLVYVDKDGLSSAMLNRLMRLAAFQNPEFYRAQSMRLSTLGKPRVIHCGEEFPRHFGLPSRDHVPFAFEAVSHGEKIRTRPLRCHSSASACGR